MKFQNIGVHGSKVMLCTRKRDERTNERRNRQARSNMPPTVFKADNLLISFKSIFFFRTEVNN